MVQHKILFLQFENYRKVLFLWPLMGMNASRSSKFIWRYSSFLKPWSIIRKFTICYHRVKEIWTKTMAIVFQIIKKQVTSKVLNIYDHFISCNNCFESILMTIKLIISKKRKIKSKFPTVSRTTDFSKWLTNGLFGFLVFKYVWVEKLVHGVLKLYK